MEIKDNTDFIKAHPDLAERFDGDFDWMNNYTNYDNGRITERWERDKNGKLVNVTAREKAKEEVRRAQEELHKLNGQLLKGGPKHAKADSV